MELPFPYLFLQLHFISQRSEYIDLRLSTLQFFNVMMVNFISYTICNIGLLINSQ
jgi:hypothetical protein